MKNLVLAIFLAIPCSAAATAPPIDIPFEEKVCRATHVFVGQASNFEVVAQQGCDGDKSGKYLSMCQDVQVTVAVSKAFRPAKFDTPNSVIFRFGGGLFSVDSLRKDLLGKPRYFLAVQSEEDETLVYRTSYGWFLGGEATPATEKLITEALAKCAAPNTSFKVTRRPGTHFAVANWAPVHRAPQLDR
jgi:hypothetical protein